MRGWRRGGRATLAHADRHGCADPGPPRADADTSAGAHGRRDRHSERGTHSDAERNSDAHPLADAEPDAECHAESEAVHPRAGPLPAPTGVTRELS